MKVHAKGVECGSISLYDTERSDKLDEVTCKNCFIKLKKIYDKQRFVFLINLPTEGGDHAKNK